MGLLLSRRKERATKTIDLVHEGLAAVAKGKALVSMPTDTSKERRAAANEKATGTVTVTMMAMEELHIKYCVPILVAQVVYKCANVPGVLAASTIHRWAGEYSKCGHC